MISLVQSVSGSCLGPAMKAASGEDSRVGVPVNGEGDFMCAGASFVGGRELAERAVKNCLISIVMPVFNEAGQIQGTLAEVRRVLQSANLSYELLVVDDGSADETWARLVEWSAQEPALKAIRLSRNFGKEAALCAGLDRAVGDACIVMDADLQHPPGLIPGMVSLWRESGFPIVEALKRSRGKEGLVNKLGARIFYNLMARFSGMDLRQASDFKLLDARLVAAWRLLREREMFFRGITAWLGFPRAQVYFEVPSRVGGKSRWSSLRLFKLALSAITSFSALPLQLVTTLGLLFLAGAIPLGIQTLYHKFRGVAVSGFTTVITLQLIIGSILMISLGIIGTYVARVFEEVKQRPRYIVSDAMVLSGSPTSHREESPP